MKIGLATPIEGIYQKVLPQNIEAEQSVLGSILIDNEALPKVLEIIEPNDFYRDNHKKIFLAFLELFENNIPLDIITVTELLQKKGELTNIGGATYLASLVDSVPTTANITHYAKIIKEKSILRSLIAKATDIVNLGFEASEDVAEILDKAEEAIFSITQQRIQTSYYSIKEIIKQTFETIEELSSKKDSVTGIPTGFIDFDRLTAGLQPSDLIIIAGRPVMGKTSFTLNIAQHAATRAGVPVGFFSLEMSKEQLALRMLCAEARINSQKIRSGFLSERDWLRLTDAAATLSEAPIFIDDTPALSVLEIRAKARRLKSEHNIGLIIVDYLQLMKGKGRVDTREREISEISRSLKALAKELNIPVVAVSQLNRRVEERENKRPRLADLRESGAIEQDADLIVFIYRDEVYNEDTPDKGIAEIIIGKQRSGPTGVVKLAFLDKYTRFENLLTRD